MKSIRTAILAAALCVITMTCAHALSYADTNPHWAGESIAYVTDRGLMTGVDATHFAPNTAATRADLVMALYRASGSPVVLDTSTTFDDVSATASYAAAVSWGVSTGVVTGITSHEFRPLTAITREQLSTILYRYAALRGDILPRNASASISSFNDVRQIRSYAMEPVSWALQTNLLTGRPGGLFSSSSAATRAELAVIIQRYLTNAQSSGTGEVDSVKFSAATAFNRSDGLTIRTEITSTGTSSAVSTRTYTFPEGHTVQMGRVEAKSTQLDSSTASSYYLPGSSGILHRYDETLGTWLSEPLTDTVLARGTYFLEVGDAELMITTPLTYRSRDNSVIEYIPSLDGSLVIARQSGGFSLTLSVPSLSSGTFSDYLLVTSLDGLVNWNSDAALSRWATCRLTSKNRWCYTGHYYETPSTYYPYGANYYNNMPAAHVAGNLVTATDDPAAEVLSLAMLDVMIMQQNGLGYVPSLAGSTWLHTDYGIEPGYFDTRFNTDLFVACLRAYENFDAEECLDAAVRYGDFLVFYAGGHHFAVRGDGYGEGWLVQDYWQASGTALPTHVSLNHHASEAVFLYRLANELGIDSYAILADRMVLGVELTEDHWIMPNGNLRYSYNPDGTSPGTDYPYLTYNDLLELQQLYQRRHSERSDSLDRLMDSKRRWMDANGVTQYNKE